jgi:hypothetical protein
MQRITLSASALAAAMNAELYRRGVPAFVRVAEVVREPADAGGADWSLALERSPVPLHEDATATRFAEALFGYEAEVGEVAAWAADRFTVAWEAPAREAVFVPSPVHAGAAPPGTVEPVAAEKTAGGD